MVLRSVNDHIANLAEQLPAMRRRRPPSGPWSATANTMTQFPHRRTGCVCALPFAVRVARRRA
eukprot:5424472-Lingulodinium_polyedra.AAC.1